MNHRFISDRTLGRLTKWIRLLGYDCRYCPQLSVQNPQVPVPFDEYDVILTRQKKLYNIMAATLPSHQLIFILDNYWKNQVIQVIDELHLPIPTEYSIRCSACGGKLHHIDKDSIVMKVPPYVYETQCQFVACDQCERVYWKGTQFQGIAQLIDQFFTKSPGQK